MASAAAAAASSADWLSTADRLALLIQRYGLAEDKVAQQLGWPLEQLRAYLAPDTRVQATSDVVDNAADKLLMRYRVAMARQTLAGAASGPLAPVEASARRSVLPAAFSRAVIDRRSVIHAQPTPAQQRASTERQAAAATAAVTGGIASRRKRKRKVLAQDLSVADGPTPASSSSTAEPRKLRIRPGAVDLVCPIRLDVDVDGVRYQDTFLLDASSASCTPERMASQIAIDEKLPDSVQNALAESIRRQLMTFCTSAASSFDVMPDRLYPIYLDIIIGGISLRDQIEWDITNDFPSAQSFASTLCADLNLSPAFESATAFSIWEQVVAYRTALGFRKWIGVEPTSNVQPKVNSDTSMVGAGFIDSLPPLEANTPEELDVIRHSPDTALWQPIVSELSREERTYLAAKLGATHAPTSRKNTASHDATGNHAPKRHPQHRAAPKDHKLPRPINPFIMYCQVQKDIFAKSKSRKSASETRKIFGDMWRKCTDEEKEYYAQLTEAENEKRRREYILDQRDRAIAEWEEDEARRKGLLSSALLDATPEYLRGLLLEDYVNERHEVDVNRAHASVDEDEDVDNDE